MANSSDEVISECSICIGLAVLAIGLSISYILPVLGSTDIIAMDAILKIPSNIIIGILTTAIVDVFMLRYTKYTNADIMEQLQGMSQRSPISLFQLPLIFLILFWSIGLLIIEIASFGSQAFIQLGDFTGSLWDEIPTGGFPGDISIIYIYIVLILLLTSIFLFMVRGIIHGSRVNSSYVASNMENKLRELTPMLRVVTWPEYIRHKLRERKKPTLYRILLSPKKEWGVYLVVQTKSGETVCGYFGSYLNTHNSGIIIVNKSEGVATYIPESEISHIHFDIENVL